MSAATRTGAYAPAATRRQVTWTRLGNALGYTNTEAKRDEIRAGIHGVDDGIGGQRQPDHPRADDSPPAGPLTRCDAHGSARGRGEGHSRPVHLRRTAAITASCPLQPE